MIYFNMGHNDIDYDHKYESTNRTLSHTSGSAIRDWLIVDALLWLGGRSHDCSGAVRLSVGGSADQTLDAAAKPSRPKGTGST